MTFIRVCTLLVNGEECGDCARTAYLVVDDHRGSRVPEVSLGVLCPYLDRQIYLRTRAVQTSRGLRPVLLLWPSTPDGYRHQLTTNMESPAVEDAETSAVLQQPDVDGNGTNAVLQRSDVEGKETNDVGDKQFATAPGKPKTTDNDTVHEKKETKHAHPNQPGKPICLECGSDFILLGWDGPQSEGVEFYEIKYKVTKKKSWNRKMITTEDDKPQFRVRGLVQETEYMFKVKAQYEDDEGDFSEPSDSIQTTQSPALGILKRSMKLQDGEPAFYKLPVVEILKARNTKYRTRKFELEAPLSGEGFQEKTIMMIGATGAGKSTLIDGMVNHLLGVKWEDDFRFKIIDLMPDEETRKGSEADSQTEWITSYRVHPMNKNVHFIYNIIDTPGFGATTGIERDRQLADQIRAFFTTKGVQGIETIDAVCFVTQAPLARLTPPQRYIYESILSIFGKDMKDNFVTMITFADGKEPPVLNALVTAEVPINKHFLFNNSALFEANNDAKGNRFGKLFWEMGLHSYDSFFYYLPQIKSQSLQLTAEVLRKREQINVTIAGLLLQIKIGLSDLETLKKEEELVNKFANEIDENKNFTYETEESCRVKVYLEPGECVTHCGHCDYTCHYPCGYTTFVTKLLCSAMSMASCTVCPGKCGWRFHGNRSYRYTDVKKKVERSYEEMKTKFDLATERKVTKEMLLENIKERFDRVKKNVCEMINEVRANSNYIRQNAIKANPLTEIEYLQVLIKAEQQQNKSGFRNRVDMLLTCMDAAIFKAKASFMSTDALMENYGLKDKDM